MAQGTHNSNRPPLLDDLDALITSRALRPAKVKLGGRHWTLKRDFTAEQILRFWVLADEGKNADAFAMMVGEKDGPELARLVAASPSELITPVLRRLYQHAGLLKRIETVESEPDGDNPENLVPAASAEDTGEGESSAS